MAIVPDCFGESIIFNFIEYLWGNIIWGYQEADFIEIELMNYFVPSHLICKEKNQEK